jgi:outer membrane protein
MRKAFWLLTTVILTLLTGTARADTLDGRLGLTGKGGALVPLQDDFISSTSKSRAGLAAGGGLIYGFGGNLAAEVDVTHVLNLDVETSGAKAFEATLTDVAVGLQYRVATASRLTPFFGAGVDFIKGTLKSVNGANYDMDWTEGGHVNVGFDYFLTRGLAFTADLRGLIAFKGDIKNGGGKVGEYEPTSFIGTLGVRLILPETMYW